MNFEEQTGWKDREMWAEGAGGFHLLKDRLRSLACAAGYVVGHSPRRGDMVCGANIHGLRFTSAKFEKPINR